MEKNARLVYVNSEYSRTPEGQLFFEIRGSFAKYERIKIQDRFQRGKRGKLRKGLPISNHHILGFDWNGENYVINPAQAEIVRSIFDRYANHIGGIQSVADWLNGKGIPSPQGKQWSSTAVNRLLRHKITPEEKRQFVLDHISKVIVLRKDFVSRYDVDLDVTIIFGS